LTPQELIRVAPHETNHTDIECLSSSPIPKQTVRYGALAKKKGKGGNSARSVVSITSCRVRLLDPDNLTPKYFIDSLRYAGIIHDDREADIIYQITQEKVEKKDQEKTIISVSI